MFKPPENLPPINIPKETKEVILSPATPTSPPKNLPHLTPPRAPMKPNKKIKINN
jgi:hypothetical protein